MGNSKRSTEGDGQGPDKKVRKARPDGRGQTEKSGRGRKAAASAAKAATDPTHEAAPAPSFESALERLEGSVARLEEGEMPLEEALELFESGVKLSRQCQSTLEEAERRIEILVADRGGATGEEHVMAFESEEDADDESAFEA